MYKNTTTEGYFIVMWAVYIRKFVDKCWKSQKKSNSKQYINMLHIFDFFNYVLITVYFIKRFHILIQQNFNDTEMNYFTFFWCTMIRRISNPKSSFSLRMTYSWNMVHVLSHSRRQGITRLDQQKIKYIVASLKILL